MLDWTIQPNSDEIIIGTNKNYPINFTKILLFDLDHTIILPKSGNKFPKNKDDWKLFNENVKTILQSYKNAFIGIITNQSGLRGEKQNDWMYKLNEISKQIPIHFVFASIGHNNYRKPATHSWLYLKNYLNTTCTNVTYVGDAFGRVNDFSDTDLKFALNCGFKYKTPERFFKTENYIPEQFTVTVPDLHYYTDIEIDKMLDNIHQLSQIHLKVQIIMIGLPASGKSFLSKLLQEKFTCIYYNKDLKHKYENFSNLNTSNVPNTPTIFINDNTNLTFNAIEKFNNFHTIYVKFNHQPFVLKYLNAIRQWKTGKFINDIVYNTMNKKITPIIVNENDTLIVIDKLFPGMRCDDLKYFV